MEKMKNRWIALYVENQVGVLAKVSGLFSAKSYNLQTLTVGTTERDDVSRMTISVKADDVTFEQIKKQLSKLVEVISIKHCHKENTTQREMALIKVKASGTDRAVIIETCDIFRAHIIDVAQNSVIVEATGSEEKIASLIRLLEPYGILELCKTGLTAMGRGEEVLK